MRTKSSRAAGDLARKKEDAWFRARDRQLLEKAQKESQRRAWRARLAEVVGVADEAYLEDLEEHGFAPETVPLLFVVPLFMVAWSDGEVSEKERRKILQVARERGLDPKSPAWARLEGWLAARPGPSFFEHAFKLLRRMLDANPEAKERVARHIVDRSVEVAEASGGFLGIGPKVMSEESTLLDQIAKDLGVPAPTRD
ncbi:MAG: hypothetical protein ACM3JH_09135 [Acidithiobacillales bacterium]